jgi:alpha-N-arabinofuranosidase
MWGEHQIGHLSADDYVKKARRWASALRRADPEIELVACGNDGLSEWDRIVVDGLVGYVDYHSIHIYTGSHDYWENVLAPHRAERALRICGALIERARHLQHIDREVGIAYDEWNVWYRETDGRRGFEERYTLADALAVATFLNIFVRQCRVLRMANLAQMVNVLAPMLTSREGLLLQASYHPLRLFAEHVQDIALDPLVACETPVHGLAGMGPLGVLDVAATRDADCRRAAITIVNRSPDKSVLAAVRTGRRIPGEVRVHVVHADSIDAVNTFAKPDVVDVRTSVLQPAGEGFELSLAPHSFACVELPIG